MNFWLYLLECADQSLYLGHTDDLEKRMEQHSQGKGAAYTARRLPVTLLHAEGFPSREQALEMEMKLKKWSRQKKLAWARGDWRQVSALARGPNRGSRLG